MSSVNGRAISQFPSQVSSTMIQQMSPLSKSSYGHIPGHSYTWTQYQLPMTLEEGYPSAGRPIGQTFSRNGTPPPCRITTCGYGFPRTAFRLIGPRITGYLYSYLLRSSIYFLNS